MSQCVSHRRLQWRGEGWTPWVVFPEHKWLRLHPLAGLILPSPGIWVGRGTNPDSVLKGLLWKLQRIRHPFQAKLEHILDCLQTLQRNSLNGKITALAGVEAPHLSPITLWSQWIHNYNIIPIGSRTSSSKVPVRRKSNHYLIQVHPLLCLIHVTLASGSLWAWMLTPIAIWGKTFRPPVTVQNLWEKIVM